MDLLKEFSIKPVNMHLYKIAFIHQSYSFENNLNECYERLEFLGDAILDLVVSEFLYNSYPDLKEGELTRMRANYVCKKALYTYSMELGLDKYIKVGIGEKLSQREIDSIVSDVFESFTGALYLDLGLDAVKKFLSKTVFPHIESEDIFFYDYKSQLKELCDQNALDVIYELINEKGSSHNKTFTIAVVINGKQYGTGIGGSKKEAEQQAAHEALNKLESN